MHRCWFRAAWLLATSLSLAGCRGMLGGASREGDAPSSPDDAPAVVAALALPSEPESPPPRAPRPCFVDEGTPAGAELALSVAASRVRGVAPLAVFFDTAGTRAAATARPFHELAYCWDFGDAEAGVHSPTGLPRNEAKGPVAAHVFERPGVHTVSVVARDAVGRVATRTVEITVEDPEEVFRGERTVCFSASGDFTGCPVGARRVTAASMSALAAEVGPGKRLLLHRGESFSGADVSIDVPGPGMVGAFGDSSTPRPKITHDGGLFGVASRTPRFSDWRIVDVDFDGQGSPSAQLLHVDGRAEQLLLLRVRASRMGAGLMAPNSIIDYWNAHGFPGHDVIDTFVVQDCELREVVGGSGHDLAYVAAHRFALLGSRLLDSTAGEHVLRAPWLDRGVLSSNELGHAPSPRHVLKIHAPGFEGTGVGRGRPTERVVISDNLVRASGGSDWTVAIGPQNESSDERVRDVLVERNVFLRGEAAQVALLIWARDVTVRNNLFDRGGLGLCVSVGRRGIEPPPDAIELVHNTCVSDVETRLVRISGGATGVHAFNNLIAGRAGGEVGAGLEREGGNVVTREAVLRRVPPSGWRDFVLGPRSVAVDAAAPGPFTPWDASGAPRPTAGARPPGGVADVGALEASR